MKNKLQEIMEKLNFSIFKEDFRDLHLEHIEKIINQTSDHERSKKFFHLGQFYQDKYSFYYQWVCENGYLEIIRWFIDENKVDNMEIERAFNVACIHNHIDIVKYLYQTQNLSKFILERSFQMSSYENYLQILKWLFSESKIIQDFVTQLPHRFESLIGDIIEKVGHPLKIAIMSNHVELSEWLMSKQSQQIKFLHIESAFLHACRIGHFKTVKFVILKFDLKKEDLSSTSSIFLLVCIYNNLEFAQWFFSRLKLMKDDVNILPNFEAICACSNLKMLEWLFSLFQWNKENMLKFNPKIFDLALGEIIMRYQEEPEIGKWLILTLKLEEEDLISEKSMYKFLIRDLNLDLKTVNVGKID